MLGTKKLAKRSIIGTRISALWPQDGRFYPGIVQSLVHEETITKDAVYNITFDDGFTHHIKYKNIVGFGFQPVTSVTLKKGQKVFLTLNGREVGGVVLNHDYFNNDVVVNLINQNGEYYDTTRKLEEIRLFESRKSARLLDHTDTDYSKLADSQLNMTGDSHISKRRITSQVIDVPAPSYEKHNFRLRRRQRHFSEDMSVTDHRGDNVSVSIDETVAALVLTSLSVSPASPSWTSASVQSSNKEQAERYHPYQNGHLSISIASGEFFMGHSERYNHSPPLTLSTLSESAPATMEYNFPSVGGDKQNPNISGQVLTNEETEGIIYKCTWRGCSEITSSRKIIERHIRRSHFHRDSDTELTDNEEDFYYTEMDANYQAINTITKSFAALNTLSSNEKIGSKHICKHINDTEKWTVMPCEADLGRDSNHDDSLSGTSTNSDPGGERIYDHVYLQRGLTASFPSSGITFSEVDTTSLSVTLDNGFIKKSLSWQSNYPSPGVQTSPSQRPNKTSQHERSVKHQAQSPKSNLARSTFIKMAQYKRTRSDVRKCRKVYGMENRELWCTQCKWKKACTKFID